VINADSILFVMFTLSIVSRVGSAVIYLHVLVALAHTLANVDPACSGIDTPASQTLEHIVRQN
jgi:hypothetical protein